MKFEKMKVTYCVYRVVIEDKKFKEVFWIEDENCEINNTEQLWNLIVSQIQCIRKDDNELLFYKSSNTYSGIFDYWFKLPLYKDFDDCQLEYDEAKAFASSLYEYINL